MRLLPVILIGLCAGPAAADDGFERLIRPLLADQCVKCHGPAKQGGGLRLDSRAALMKGGDSGPAAVSGKPDDSLVVRAVEHHGELRMPSAKQKLPAADAKALREWVARGLPWPEKVEVTGTGAPADDGRRAWWAYQPVKVVPPPAVKNTGWPRDDIDRYVLAKQEAAGLTPSPPADRRTLLRRASYGLTGLPPTFEQVETFINDSSPDAFAKAIDKLFASPHYGETWGRHWLDVVRYADTAGDNADYPAPHAWRYRNWVIDALNADLPYDEFVRQQVAGDLLHPGKAGPTVATGFWAVARRFGHESDKEMHLTREDAIDTFGRAFLGQSIACARCHDHKYDPFTAKDYYALAGILESTRFPFAGCEAKNRPRDLVALKPPESPMSAGLRARRLAVLDAAIQKATGARTAAAREIADLDRAGKKLAAGSISDGGSQPFPPDATVEVRAGEALRLSVSPLTSHGADSTLVELVVTEVGGAGRVWNLTADLLDEARPTRSAWHLLGGAEPFAETFTNLQGYAGLCGWKTQDTPSAFVTRTDKRLAPWPGSDLPPRSAFVHPGTDRPASVLWVSPFAGKVKVLGRVADAHPGGPDGVGWGLDHLTADVGLALKNWHRVQQQATALTAERAGVTALAPKPELAYAVAESKPVDSFVQLRGDPEKPGPVVPRRWLDLFGGQTVLAGQGSGRRQLADRLTDAANPLLARVMVNRVWQQHFGRGLVATPNDFGTRGEKPSHPELLDRLAADFAKDGYSLKKLHRRIMLSATYQQASAPRPDAAAIDPNNVMLWRFDRRRLSAEEVRDGLLLAGGMLDRTPGGPHPFPPESRWNFTQHGPFASFYETDRRSVYLVQLRNRRHPFLALFDGADPNASTGRRQATTVPTQALFFMNDSLVFRVADGLATRVYVKADDAARLDELFRITLQRLPTPAERQKFDGFRKRYAVEEADARNGWAALARVVLSGNEFIHPE